MATKKKVVPKVTTTKKVVAHKPKAVRVTDNKNTEHTHTPLMSHITT